MKVLALVAVLLVMASPALGRSLMQAPTPAAGITDVDILTFALNLEYLEAEFYSCAAYGTPLSTALRGGGPASTGCAKATLTGAAQAYAVEIAQDEIAHVTFLRSALQAAGITPIAIPQLNIGTSFSAAANLAFNANLSPAFSPYLNNLFFYLGAFIFEDVGVTAYAGAAPLISNKAYLTAAAKVLAVESYHAAVIRTLLFQNAGAATPYTNVTVGDAVQAISDLRDAADGAGDDDQGVLDSDRNMSDLVPTDANGLVYARTPEQVLNIVTFGGGKTGGGFFPNGLNGYFGSS